MTVLPIPPDADIVPAPVSDGFTVEDVLAWALSKPADGVYNYTSPRNCALCRFLIDTRRARNPMVMPHVSRGRDGGGTWREAGVERTYPVELEIALTDESGMAHPATFGALATRLQALLP